MHVWEQRYKRPDGTVPWWAKFMAIWFAVMACLTIFGVGSAVQTSAITSVAQANFGVEPWIVAAVVCGSALLIIMGGLGTISNICEKLVPIMGVAYILGCIYILVCNWAFIGESFRLIFECAFTPRAAFGGAVGSGIIVALQFGCARGLFSNEAGLGTAPLISAAAESKNPARQALVSMTGPFWCTVVICFVTALVIVSSLCAHPTLIQDAGVTNGATLANAVFATIPYVGAPILMPVSYTHLDVYKRQVTEDSPACSSGEIILLEVTELDEDGQPAAFELVAVSYTHLHRGALSHAVVRRRHVHPLASA